VHAFSPHILQSKASKHQAFSPASATLPRPSVIVDGAWKERKNRERNTEKKTAKLGAEHRMLARAFIRSLKFGNFGTVALLFVFGNYYLIMN
jgi:hypothetical protein